MPDPGPCGGCQGLGAHTRACRDPIGHLAELVEGLGDRIGSNAPELANTAYAIAGDLRRHGTRADHERDTLVRDLARAHGRPEAAERTAWGLPAAPTPDKARHENVAGLPIAPEDT